MKKTVILLLSLVSISVAAQEHVWAGYPKWFIETIPYLSKSEIISMLETLIPLPLKPSAFQQV